MKTTLTCLALLTVAACGGVGAGPADLPTDGTVGGDAMPQLAWADMNADQRGHYMQDVVVPRMGALFTHDPDFGCETCHGDNMVAVNFEMPNVMAPLDPNSMPFQSDDEQTRAVAQGMMERVTPLMVELLGAEPFDPETNEGFGCFGCHATHTED